MDAWQWLDQASDLDARSWLATCCGSRAWVERMLAYRPFGSGENLLALARQEWFALTPDDWREAFGHHPRIGDRAALRDRFPQTAALSAAEQAGVSGASDATLDALARLNEEYERTFGYLFIVCASGKSAAEMLDLLRRRLANAPAEELLIAAGEQARITALRLQRRAGG